MRISFLAALTLLGSTSLLSAAANLLADPGFEGATPVSQISPDWNLVANQPDGTNFSLGQQS